MMRGNIDRASGTSWRTNERTSNRTNGRCRFWPGLYGKLAVGQASVMVVDLGVELHTGSGKLV